nr:MAG TPA: hypothetical protein [Bacteriophage sp.]
MRTLKSCKSTFFLAQHFVRFTFRCTFYLLKRE